MAGASAVVLAASAVALSQPSIAQASTNAPTQLYIVQLTDLPLTTYDGRTAGFAATKPQPGHKFDAHTSAATKYASHLRSKQLDVLKSAGVDTSKTIAQYDSGLDAVAVPLTAAQVNKLNTNPAVQQVWKNRIITIPSSSGYQDGASAPAPDHIKAPPPSHSKRPGPGHSDGPGRKGHGKGRGGHHPPPPPPPPPAQIAPTPQFLGLTGKKGVWDEDFGSANRAGEGVIIGDIDTGFWPESPSFAPLPEPRGDDATIAADFHGSCNTAGDVGVAVTCNNKVIGAQFFGPTGIPNVIPGEFNSPRDYDGHGSHTASTAAGDFVQHVMINGVDAGAAEGVAPGARLSIYKGLWETGSTASGSDVDLVNAIDHAISDGVDVINYSIGDNVDSFGPEELAFLNAASAGIFVSAAAGNAGPGASTVDNAMPWETTDAAGTYDRAFTKTVTLGDGESFTGVGVGAAVPSSPLIDSVNAGLSSADPSEVELCFDGTLDPAKVTGKIVLCLRGVNDRIAKSQAVRDAGGIGMILYNPPEGGSLNADFHFVPTVHLQNAAGVAIKNYIAGTANPTASLAASVAASLEAPQVAGFSSRGPSLFSNGDLLKPDVLAPGNDVIAAVSPVNHNGNLYDTESGTSMATPHIAGTAALILSKHPTWSPGAVKSAILTTAQTTDNKGKPITNDDGSLATPFDYGAGEVDVADALDPGLVYDEGLTDWLQYACALDIHLLSGGTDVCTLVPPKGVSDLNYPTIAVGALPGVQTITRTVTNVSGKTSHYKATVKAPPGFTASVSPRSFTIHPGATVTYTVTLTRTTAPVDQYAFGSVTWSDSHGHRVRSTIAVQPVSLAAPPTVDLPGASGSTSINATPGYDGQLTTTALGLHPAEIAQGLNLVEDDAGFNLNDPQPGPGTFEFAYTVPAGTVTSRVESFASDFAPGTDVDLFVYKSDGGNLTLAGFSAGGTASEEVDTTGPGDYVVFEDVFLNPTNAPITVTAYHWEITPSTVDGNFTAAPASQSVTEGTAAPVTLTWTGLTTGTHYLGVVEYGDGTNTIGTTIVTANP